MLPLIQLAIRREMLLEMSLKIPLGVLLKIPLEMLLARVLRLELLALGHPFSPGRLRRHRS